MINKKKLNFWRLFSIFSTFTFIVLLALWINPVQKATMMTQGMAGMASSMHLQNSTIYDVLKNEESANASQTITNTSNNQMQEDKSEVKTLGLLTTLVIFGLLPLIIGGSIVLAIVWIK